MNTLTFLRPNKLIFVLFILIGLSSSIIPYGIEFTTKITWEQYHGIPFTFLQVAGCFGTCNPRKYFIQEFDANILILDALIWYAIACFVVYGLSIFIRSEKVKAIVTGRR